MITTLIIQNSVAYLLSLFIDTHEAWAKTRENRQLGLDEPVEFEK